MRYRLDRSWRRHAGGRVVLGGSPLRLFRLTEGGARVIDAVESGPLAPTPSITQFLDRFVDAGALHPAPDRSPYAADDVTVVMPCFGDRPDPPPGMRTVLVDDHSPDPVRVERADTRVLRHPRNLGPAAARNTGLAEVTTPLVAFVDTDVALPDAWLDGLLVHFSDPRVALVAPRVASAPGAGRLARYEVAHSPLDLGADPARVAPSTRVGYVPAAVLVCRTEVVRALGGFATDLRFGEDVDFVWRLVAAGHRARYEPGVVVVHTPRSTWEALWRQRIGYGSSAAPLARRHRGALAPVRTSAWSLTVWAALAARRPVVATALAGGTALALVRKLRGVPAGVSLRLALGGHAAAGGQLAQATRRVWWPVALGVAVVSRRARPALAAAYLVPPLAAAVRDRSWRSLADAPTTWVDDTAYGVGVWCGVVRLGEPAPLIPVVSSWPPRGAG